MVRDVRVKDYTFRVGSLTADGDGLFTVFSDGNVNGTIQSVTLLSNTFTTTGSLLIFNSGLSNSGTSLGDSIITIRAGSVQTYYPIVYGNTNQVGTGSPQAFVRPTINGVLRLVGSGLGDSTSGLGLIVRYI